jgi:hypothetical protein
MQPKIECLTALINNYGHLFKGFVDHFERVCAFEDLININCCLSLGEIDELNVYSTQLANLFTPNRSIYRFWLYNVNSSVKKLCNF